MANSCDIIEIETLFGAHFAIFVSGCVETQIANGQQNAVSIIFLNKISEQPSNQYFIKPVRGAMISYGEAQNTPFQ